MFRIDYEVVQYTGRPAERHVVGSLNGEVRVADYIPAIIGDKDYFVRIFELCTYEGRIVCWRPGSRGQEALWIEVVMLLDEKRTETANPW